ncbi:MAG: hypothetical protein KAY22_04440 [Rhizorhabdus sp.]|uniref:hypothetical protein n=1 Tax=Rhizorhabdus sp. TaxID=1968843 RepID=UPI001B4A700F|nr:hypothetical protein [Rhizorhabdus sp.]MBP8231533.1 hypothetical protein [Rhizorhabdus sp.]
MERAVVHRFGGRRWAFGLTWYNGDSEVEAKGSLRDQAASMVDALKRQGANAVCLRRDGISQYAVADLPPEKSTRPGLFRKLHAGAAALATILPPDALGCWPMPDGDFLGLALTDGMVVPSTDIVLDGPAAGLGWLLDEIRSFGAGVGDRAEIFVPIEWTRPTDATENLIEGLTAERISNPELRDACLQLARERSARGLTPLLFRASPPVEDLLDGLQGVAPLEAPGRLGNLGPALRHPAIAAGVLVSVCTVGAIITLNDRVFRRPAPQIAAPVQAAIRLQPGWMLAPSPAEFVRTCREALGRLVVAPPAGWVVAVYGCEPSAGTGAAFAQYQMVRPPSEDDLKALRTALQPRAIEFVDTSLRNARVTSSLPPLGSRPEEEPLDRQLLYERLLRLRKHTIEVAIGDGGRAGRQAALPGAAASSPGEHAATTVTMTGPLSLRHWSELMQIPGLVLTSVKVDLAGPGEVGGAESGLQVTVRGEVYARS